MKWLERDRMRLVLVGIVVGIVFGGGSAKADFTFGTPTNLGPPVNSGYSEGGPTISPDGLELYFTSNRPVPGFDEWNLWMVTRPTQDDDWSEPVHFSLRIDYARNMGDQTIGAIRTLGAGR